MAGAVIVYVMWLCASVIAHSLAQCSAECNCTLAVHAGNSKCRIWLGSKAINHIERYMFAGASVNNSRCTHTQHTDPRNETFQLLC